MSRGVSSKITFKTYDQSEQWLLPPSLEELVPENHLVRVVSATVDEIELKALFESYTKGGGNVKHCTSLSIFEREFWAVFRQGWRGQLNRNDVSADRMSVVVNRIEFFIRKTRSSQMYKDVHL